MENLNSPMGDSFREHHPAYQPEPHIEKKAEEDPSEENVENENGEPHLFSDLEAFKKHVREDAVTEKKKTESIRQEKHKKAKRDKKKRQKKTKDTQISTNHLHLQA